MYYKIEQHLSLTCYFIYGEITHFNVQSNKECTQPLLGQQQKHKPKHRNSEAGAPSKTY